MAGMLWLERIGTQCDRRSCGGIGGPVQSRPMRGMLDLDAVHQPVASIIAQQLDQVSVIFERQLASDMSAVNKLCMHVEHYRGKMLRPTLVLLSGLASCGEAAASDGSILTENHRVLAAVVEMIHMATLVHDDVLDEADIRRRGATVNRLWGNETAVILGDYLISNAFHLCSTMGEPAINLALGDVTNTLCEGELVQLHHRDDYSIDEAMYLEIVRRKTASLIGECCRLGAALSRAEDRVCKALQGFGIALGVAFQIQDDLLDLVGEPSVVGKSLGKDLDKGKLTLPLIYHVAQATQQGRGEALRLIMQRDAAALRTRLIESGAVQRTVQTAQRLAGQAEAKLAHVPPGSARTLLGHLAETVVSRSS
jgi:octaprenyl-diphosphate synthase